MSDDSELCPSFTTNGHTLFWNQDIKPIRKIYETRHPAEKGHSKTIHLQAGVEKPNYPTMPCKQRCNNAEL